MKTHQTFLVLKLLLRLDGGWEKKKAGSPAHLCLYINPYTCPYIHLYTGYTLGVYTRRQGFLL
jgi:hypothetical protein